mgnify:CR=1 FL=1
MDFNRKDQGYIMGLSGKEKFSYGLGAVGKDMVYMLSASYILSVSYTHLTLPTIA